LTSPQPQSKINLLAQHNNLVHLLCAFNNHLVFLHFIFLQFAWLPYWHAFFSKEEKLRLVREYRAAHTYTSLRQAFDAVITAEHELAVKKGIKLPPPPVAKHLPVHQESQKLREWQQPSSTAAQPQHSTAPGKSRYMSGLYVFFIIPHLT
jgi:hypothetical protein